MVDPLSDPRAADLLDAVAEDVTALAAAFRAAADQSELTAAGLQAAQHDGTWAGSAADRFRTAIGRLPGRLARVRAGYAAVADALVAYEPELARLRWAFAHTAAELSAARSRAGDATADPVAGEQHQQEVIRLTRRAADLLDEFSAARRGCRDAIAAAQHGAVIRPLGA
ncbi:MAG TPA: hypothetical protein VFN87_18370 [Solirubrobacteraceae bacterium]|nr:hypothetical protein [Solirubrobacteraceae bacterium]